MWHLCKRRSVFQHQKSSVYPEFNDVAMAKISAKAYKILAIHISRIKKRREGRRKRQIFEFFKIFVPKLLPGYLEKPGQTLRKFLT